MATENNTPPDLLTLSDLSQKDRIQILLSEYSTLRSEILSRTGWGFQEFVVGFALVTWLLKSFLENPPWYFWGVLVVIAAAFGIAIFINVRDLTRAAHRIKELEHEINSRAGEHLLIWETLSGVLTRMGIIRSYFSRAKSLPRSELPPLDPSYLQRSANRPRNDPGR